MDNNKMIMVKNRSASMVIYKIPEHNIRREFSAGETKKLPLAEIEQLTYQAGGRELIANFLQINDESITSDLNVATQPEYYMSEEQIVELIKTGTLAAFLDCLDYAPIGVIDLLKKYAVSLPLNDAEKRDALKSKTGFDVEAAIRHAREDATPEESIISKEEPVIAPNGRRTVTNYKASTQEKSMPKEASQTEPAITLPKYNVVKTTEKN